MNKLRDDWEKKRRKIWERELCGFDEDDCKYIPESRPVTTCCVPAKQKDIEDEEWPSS